MDVNDRLKMILERLDLSIKEFSDITGMPYTTLQQYLAKKRQPNLVNLQKISERLNINLNWLIRGEGSMFLTNKERDLSDLFLKRVKRDIKEKGWHIIDELSFKDKIEDFLDGKYKPKRIEVIELARVLDQSVEEYLSLSGYIPDVFNKVLQNNKVIGMLRNVEMLSDKEVDELIDTLSTVLEKYLADKSRDNKDDKD